MTSVLSMKLADARGQADPVAARRCLEEAVVLATYCWEWRPILLAFAEVSGAADPVRLAEIADRTLAAVAPDSPDDCAVAAFVAVARVRGSVLNDRSGAGAALEAGLRWVTDRSVRGALWRQLAQGFAQLPDAAGARRCLEAGLAQARLHRDPDDLAEIAVSLAADPEAAAPIAAEAEALLADGVQHAWMVALAWRNLGRDDAAVRTLDAAASTAGTVDEALSVADAYTAHRLTGADRALGRARALAGTGHQWWRIAQTGHRAGCAESIVRADLRQATTLADSRTLRAWIASGYRDWYGDTATADGIETGWIDPDGLRWHRRRLDGWRSSASGLLDWLRPQVTDEIVARVAEMDYGSGSKNAADLDRIRSTGQLPARPDFSLFEVLNLGSLATGPDVDHLEQAWCCTILGYCDVLYGGLYDRDPTAVLVDSCLALGAEAALLAEDFFAWLCETEPALEMDRHDNSDDGPRPVRLLALLVLRTWADPGDPRVAALSRSLLTSTWYGADGPAGLFNLGTTDDRLWQQLFIRVLVPARSTVPDLDRLLNSLVAPR